MTTPQQGGFSIGIDLGTSNTVAVVRSPDGRTRPLLFDGQPILPSVVFLDGDGRVQVGRDAQRMAQLDPARCEPNPKRRIDEGTILLGEQEVPVVRLLATILKTIADKAVETVGFLPPAAITHPAAWGNTRRGVLTEAIRHAGWPPVTLVAEPIAAARYFAEVMRRPVPVGSSLAVFDFGGGTLDVAVVRHEQNGAFAVVSSGGEQNLGGLDLDAALVAHVGSLIARQHPQIWQHLSQPTSPADRRYRRLFWEDVRGAKEMLSRATSAPVPVPGVDQAVHLTRDELERLAGPLLRQAVATTRSTIESAGLRPDELAGLFLVGGSSRVPMVARMLHAQLGVAPAVLEQPELPVAEGALAALPAGDTEATTAIGDQSAGIPFAASAMPIGVSPGEAGPVSATPASPGAPGPVSAAPGVGGPVSATPASPGGPTLGAPPPGAYPPGTPPLGAPAAPPSGDYPPGDPRAAGHRPAAPYPPGDRATAFGAAAAEPSPPWYRQRRRLLPAVAGAAVLVVLLVVGGYAVLHNPYDERPFVSLERSATVKYPVDSPQDERVQVVDGMAFLYTDSDPDDGFGSSSRLTLQALQLGHKAPTWRRRLNTPSGGNWTPYCHVAGGVVLVQYQSGTDSDDNAIPGGAVVLDEQSGHVLWKMRDSSGDSDAWMVYPDPALVLHYDSKAGTVTAYDARDKSRKWQVRHVSGLPWLDESYDEYSAAAGFTSAGNSAMTAKHSARMLFQDDDGSAQLVDASQDGKVIDRRRLSKNGTDVVYNGVLYEVGASSGYSIAAYPLDDFRSSAWSRSADPGWKAKYSVICGEKLLCVSESKDSGDDTDTDTDVPPSSRVRAYRLDDGSVAWTRKHVAHNGGAVPVGDRVLISYAKDGTVYTDVLDDDGDHLRTWPGEVARLDDATVLVANGDVRGGILGDQPDSAGRALSGNGVQSLRQDSLGTLAEDLTGCSWDDHYLACGAAEDAGMSGGTPRFTVYRFRK